MTRLDILSFGSNSLLFFFVFALFPSRFILSHPGSCNFTFDHCHVCTCQAQSYLNDTFAIFNQPNRIMANIHNLSTILVETPSINSDKRIESVIEEEYLPKTRPHRWSWARYIWDCLCIFYAYWTFVADVPLDLLYHTVSATSGSAIKDVGSTADEHSHAGDEQARPMGQLALHPKLPLLAVSARMSMEIRFYHTFTSQEVCRFKVIIPESQPHDQSRRGTVITCLQFSSGDILAVGLSDGTVHIVQQNLWAVVNSMPNSSSTSHRLHVQVVNFLTGHGSDISARFLGPVTNLVFSPTSRLDMGVSAWLAVGTEKSGVWVWNQRTKQTLRAFHTGGVKQGSLHWVPFIREVVTESKPVINPPTPAPMEERLLNQSIIQRFEKVLGNAQDMLKLDEYFAPASVKKALPSVKPDLSHLPRRPPLEEVAGTKSLDSQTVLAVGTKSGQIRVQKVWHSSTSIHMETFVDFPFRKSPNSRPKFPSNSHTAGVEISHLVVRPISLAREAVIVPMLVAFAREASSKLHEVVVHLPFNQRAVPTPWSRCAYDGAKTLLRHIVNFTFLITQTDHEWLPDIFVPSIDESVPSISYRGASSVGLSPSSPFSQASLISLSITHSHLITGGALLATLRPAVLESIGASQHDSCVVLSPSDPEVNPSTMNHLARIIPRNPNPTPFSPQPKPLPRGYYARMFAVLDPPNSYLQTPNARAESPVQHDYTCGQAQWGMSRDARVLGAFLYQPASFLDPGIGVALFEWEAYEKRELDRLSRVI